jgi:hypothetical protein
MPMVSPSRAVRGTECTMPNGKCVDALPSRDEGDYSPMTARSIAGQGQECHPVVGRHAQQGTIGLCQDVRAHPPTALALCARQAPDKPSQSATPSRSTTATMPKRITHTSVAALSPSPIRAVPTAGGGGPAPPGRPRESHAAPGTTTAVSSLLFSSLTGQCCQPGLGFLRQLIRLQAILPSKPCSIRVCGLS